MKLEKIEWIVQEYVGIEIYRNKDDLMADRKMLEPPKVGDDILCPTLSGWTKATVESDKSRLCAKAEGLVWFLTFSNDSRKCWIATSTINMSALMKLNLRTKGE